MNESSGKRPNVITDKLIPLDEVKKFVSKYRLAAWTMVSISKLQIYSPKDISIRLVNKKVKDDNLLAYIGDDDLVPPSLKSCSYDIFETIGVEQAKTVAFLFRKDKPEEFKDLKRKNASKVRTFKISANILFAGAHPLEPLKSATEETLKEAIKFATLDLRSGKLVDTSNLSGSVSQAGENCTISLQVSRVK